jgi:predicted kinase
VELAVTLYVTIGPPGSGKTTWAKDFQRSTPGRPLIVERDMIREELTGSTQNFTREVEVTRIAQDRVRTALGFGMTVIVSDTNLRAKYRKAWKKLAESAGTQYDEVSFLDVPIEVCIERDAAREHPVGEEVIRRMDKGKS